MVEAVRWVVRVVEVRLVNERKLPQYAVQWMGSSELVQVLVVLVVVPVEVQVAELDALSLAVTAWFAKPSNSFRRETSPI